MGFVCKNLKPLLHFYFLCDIINMLNKLIIAQNGVDSFCTKRAYPLFWHPNFCLRQKRRFHKLGCKIQFRSDYDLLSDNRGLRFAERQLRLALFLYSMRSLFM